MSTTFHNTTILEHYHELTIFGAIFNTSQQFSTIMPRWIRFFPLLVYQLAECEGEHRDRIRPAQAGPMGQWGAPLELPLARARCPPETPEARQLGETAPMAEDVNGGPPAELPIGDVALIGGVPWEESDLEVIYKLDREEASFLAEWIRCGRTEAYRRVFKEPDRVKAHAGAVRLMARKDVAYVAFRYRELVTKQFEVTQLKILGSYAKLAWLDLRALFTPEGHLKDITELSADEAAMIQSFEIEGVKVDGRVVGHTAKVKLVNRKEVLDSLARTQGMFIDNTVVNDAREWYVRGVDHPKSKEEWLEKNKPITH
jgi:hypothetical protein